MKFLNKLTLLSLVCILFAACNDNENTTSQTIDTDKITQTGVILNVDLDDQGLYPFHVIENAEEGSADIANSQELLASDGAITVTSKDGAIYINEYTGSIFSKLEVSESGALVNLGGLPNLGTNGNPLHTFLDDNRILLTSMQSYPEDGVYSYQIINTVDMTEESKGTFAIPVNEGNDVNYAQSFANQYISFEGHIYIPFVETDGDWAHLHNKAFVALFDATTMAFVKKIETPFTACLASGFNPSYAVSEAGDLYIASSNTNAYGGNEELPSGVVRIKAGTTDFDTDYFFDVTDITGSHSLGMLYLGNNKAVVQVLNAEALNAEEDYYVEYHLADLATKTMQKLDIPTSRGGYYGLRRSMDVLGNGNAVILSNHAEGNGLFIYNPTTNAVTPGTVYEGADAIVGVKAF
jgi:hypothetical protein